MRTQHILFALALVGCVPSIPDAVFTCTTTADCPPNQTCTGGVCHAGAFDAGMSDSGSTFDGGVDANADDAGVDAPMDAGSDADLVIVTGELTYHEDIDVTETAPLDWATLAVELRVLNGTTFSDAILPVTIDANTRGFTGVPEGSLVYLRRGAVGYTVSDHRLIKLNNDIAGRPGSVPASAAGTAVSVTANGADAWQDGDVLEYAVSNNGDYYYFDSDSLPQAIAPASTSLFEIIPWTQALIQGSTHMDRLHVFHLTSSLLPSGVDLRLLVEQAPIMPFDLADDGNTHAASGVFGPVALDQSATVTSWDVPAFEALRTDMGPALRMAAGQHYLDYQAQPNRPTGAPPFGGTIDLYFAHTNDVSAPVALGTIAYGNIYTPDTVLRGVTVNYLGQWEIPTATVASGNALLTLYSSYEERDASGMIEPLVAPPTMPMVNGTALNQVTSSTTTILPDVSIAAPIVLSWTAPTHLNAPHSYTLEIWEGFLNSTGQTHRVETAFFEVLTGTTVVVPPGLLLADRYYHVLVTSYYRIDPNMASVPNAGATTTSSFFHTVGP